MATEQWLILAAWYCMQQFQLIFIVRYTKMYGFALLLMHLIHYAEKNAEPRKYKENALAWCNQNKSACYLSMTCKTYKKTNLKFYKRNTFQGHSKNAQTGYILHILQALWFPFADFKTIRKLKIPFIVDTRTHSNNDFNINHCQCSNCFYSTPAFNIQHPITCNWAIFYSICADLLHISSQKTAQLRR